MGVDPSASEPYGHEMRAMILKEFRELARDRRTLAMLIALPLLFLVVFGYAANFTVTSTSAAVVGPGADQLAAQLPPFFEVETVEPQDTRNDAEMMLRDNEVNVAFVTGQVPVQALIDGSELFAAQATVSVLNKVGDAIQSEVLYNPDLKSSWVMVPAIIGLILTFIGVMITSIGLVREREAGTIEQLAVMPIKSSSVIFGKILPYFLVAAIDMVAITILGMWLFGVPFNGSVLTFGVGAAIFLFATLGMGVLVSTVSKTSGQAIQLAFLILLPQIMLSGMIFPLDTMAAGIRWIGYIFPLTYFNKITAGVMLRGATITSLWQAFLILLGMAIVLFTAATLRFRRDLSPGGHTKRTKTSVSDAPAAG
jgi:ABC-2 type transport system permease protein